MTTARTHAVGLQVMTDAPVAAGTTARTHAIGIQVMTDAPTAPDSGGGIVWSGIRRRRRIQILEL